MHSIPSAWAAERQAGLAKNTDVPQLRFYDNLSRLAQIGQDYGGITVTVHSILSRPGSRKQL